jgi:hypothetical protein
MEEFSESIDLYLQDRVHKIRACGSYMLLMSNKVYVLREVYIENQILKVM